jgi:hypothetical protein
MQKQRFLGFHCLPNKLALMGLRPELNSAVPSGLLDCVWSIVCTERAENDLLGFFLLDLLPVVSDHPLFQVTG